MIDWRGVLTTVASAIIVAALSGLWTKTVGSKTLAQLGPHRRLVVGSVATMFFSLAALILLVQLLWHLMFPAICIGDPASKFQACLEANRDLVAYDKSRPYPNTSNGTPVWGSGVPK